MRRLVLLTGILAVVAVGSVSVSHSETKAQADYCYSGSNIVPCPSPTVALSSVSPMKDLTVSGPTPGPAGTTSYLINVTSHIACFALTEPTDVYALANSGVAALSPLYPPQAVTEPQHVRVFVAQSSDVIPEGTARLLLEVVNRFVDGGGLAVKAVWPQEQVEKIVSLIVPATATPTATLYPAQSTPTSLPTAEPTATGTLTPTPTATAIPQPFFVHACVQPSFLAGHALGGQSATLYGHTVPGAFCIPDVTYSNGDSPSDDAYLSELATGAVANQYGIVEFPFFEDTVADSGVGTVSCASPGNEVASASDSFVIIGSAPSAPATTPTEGPDLLLTPTPTL